MDLFNEKKKAKGVLDEIYEHLKKDYIRVSVKSELFMNSESELLTYALCCSKRYMTGAIDFLHENCSGFSKVWLLMSKSNDVMALLIRSKQH